MKLNLYSARIVFLFILKQLNTESLDRNMYCACSYSLKINIDFKPLSGSLCGFLPVVSSLRSAFCCPWEVVKIHESILSCLRSSLQGSVFVIVRRDFSNLERTTATTAKKPTEKSQSCCVQQARSFLGEGLVHARQGLHILVIPVIRPAGMEGKPDKCLG